MPTIPGALAEAALRWPDGPALIDGEVRLTWSELAEQVHQVARFFAAEGVRPGDRVAVQAPNSWHWVLAALGALCTGAELVPVSTRFTAPEALDVLRRSKARALVVAEPFLGVDRLAELRAAGLTSAPDLTLILRIPAPEAHGASVTPAPRESGNLAGRVADFDTPERSNGPDWVEYRWAEVADRAQLEPAGSAQARAAGVRPDQVADVLFTSGTTGRSKGAMSSHAQSLGVAAAWAEHAELTEADRYLVVNPFFHSFGYKAGILACVLTGATIVPMAVFDVGRALALVERERITVLPGPPTLYRSILDAPARAGHDLSSLRLAVTGAAIVPVALVEEMRRELSFDCVLTAYGLTEAVVATMCRPGDDAATVARSCGRAAAGFEVRVDAPAGSVDSDTGEVLLRGPNVMLGYLDDPAATAEAVDADGWLHTGDIGRLDANGYLSITDRLKDMYIRSGFNVYPAEVEQALARLAGVAEAAVVGVPDARLGEVGAAFVVPRAGAALTAEDVLAFCRDNLAGYKVPHQVEFRAELPRNAAGKVLKTALRQSLRDRAAPDQPVPDQPAPDRAEPDQPAPSLGSP
ncbi:MAG: HIP---CoA ligase [Pseudonocardiales bacterium]|nr:HIP---CoA ligase [Pseudonocardiales bacterium]